MKSRKKSQKDNLTLDSSKSRKKSHQLKSHPNSSKGQHSNPNPNKQTVEVSNEKQEVKKYLQKTLNILSMRFKNKHTQKSTHYNTNSILNLSTSVYKIVKDNLSINKENNGKAANYDSSTLLKNNNKSSNKMLKSSTQANYYPNCNANASYHTKIKDEIQNQFLITKLSSSRKEDSQKNSRQVIISEKEKRTNSALNNYSSILDASSICQPQNSNLDQQISVIAGKRRSNSTLDNYFRDKFGANNIDDQQAVQKKLRVLKALKKSQQIVNKNNRSHIKSSLLLSNCDINQKSIVIQKLKSKKSQNFK